jgi:demethylmenaquinone methyltransferase/2-methoxy-6-polyprenyl-1,4-benzoquinol methylase
VTRATLEKDPAEVAAMFDEVAARYDLTNTVLSLGQDRGWRTAVTRALDLAPGERVLDLAAGTATSSAALAQTGADVVGLRLLARDAAGRPARRARGRRAGGR